MDRPVMNSEKYSRQILFSPIGAEGQEKLLQSKVVILGCGALGTAQANALVRAGVGTVRIVDRDFVEESNLQRQMLFDEADAKESLPKAVAAERKLRAHQFRRARGRNRGRRGQQQHRGIHRGLSRRFGRDGQL